MRALLAPLLALAAAAAVWLWVLQATGAQAPSAAPRGISANAPPATSEAARAALDPRGVLVLDARGPRGELVQGDVFFVTRPGAIQTSHQLAPDLNGALGPGVSRSPLRGSLELAVPPGHATWLRVVATAPLHAHAFARVPPFAGRQGLTIELQAGTRRMHVFVRSADLRAPVAGGEVKAYVSDLASGGPPEPVGKAITDAMGYARFDALPAGAVLVCAPGASLEHRPPQVMRAILAEADVHQEVCCTLVAPAVVHRLRFSAFNEVQLRTGEPLRLILRRRSEREGEVFPVPQALGRGAQEVSIDVPAGVYRVEALPIGAALVVPDAPVTVPAPDGAPVALRVRAGGPPVELELRGLTPADFPVHVYPHPSGETHGGDESGLYAGPWAWHVPALPVAALPYPVRLLVTGPRAAYVSRGEISLAGSKVVAELSRACSLEVRLDLAKAPSDGPVHLEVRHALGSERVPLHAGLTDAAGEAWPCLSARAVVPRGRVELVLGSASGQVLAERVLDAASLAQRVDLR